MTHLRDTTRQPLPELDRAILPRWLDRIDRDKEHVRIKAEALANRPTVDPATSADHQLHTLQADPWIQLRGIPCIARGVPGTSPGTRPG